MSETKLEEQLRKYQELAKLDKNIDVAGLMVKALESAKDNTISIKEKRWAYLLSISVPLVGFFYVIKFFTSDKEDGMQTAVICTVLSCFCLILSWLIGGALGSGISPQQAQDIQNLNPSDVYDIIR